MSARSERFIAYRARSKTLKALFRHVDCETVSIDDDSEIETLHDIVTRNAALSDANFDYSDCDSLVLVELRATKDARRFAYLDN